MWCGAAAKFANTASPCAIIPLPVWHEDTRSLTNDGYASASNSSRYIQNGYALRKILASNAQFLSWIQYSKKDRKRFSRGSQEEEHDLENDESSEPKAGQSNLALGSEKQAGATGESPVSKDMPSSRPSKKSFNKDQVRRISKAELRLLLREIVSKKRLNVL